MIPVKKSVKEPRILEPKDTSTRQPRDSVHDAIAAKQADLNFREQAITERELAMANKEKELKELE